MTDHTDTPIRAVGPARQFNSALLKVEEKVEEKIPASQSIFTGISAPDRDGATEPVSDLSIRTVGPQRSF